MRRKILKEAKASLSEFYFVDDRTGFHERSRNLHTDHRGHVTSRFSADPLHPSEIPITITDVPTIFPFMRPELEGVDARSPRQTWDNISTNWEDISTNWEDLG